MRRTGTVYPTMTLAPRPPRDAALRPEIGSSPGPLADLLGSLPRVAPPAALRERVLAAFDARLRGDLPFAQPRGRLLWLRPALLGAAAAAAAVLAVGLGGGSLLSGGGAAPSRGTRWVTIADAPASSSVQFRFVEDPSLPLQLAAAGPLEGP